MQKASLWNSLGVTKTKHNIWNNWITNVTGFNKINHFVTFDTLNVYGRNKVLHTTNQHYAIVCTTNYQKSFEMF